MKTILLALALALTSLSAFADQSRVVGQGDSGACFYSQEESCKNALAGAETDARNDCNAQGGTLGDQVFEGYYQNVACGSETSKCYVTQALWNCEL